MFTSDNGWMQGEHRIRNGKIVPYEESIRVPLIMRGLGLPAGRHVRTLVSNVDLVPTILDVAGGCGCIRTRCPSGVIGFCGYGWTG